MFFVPNEPLFSPVYLNIARVGAVLFVIIQQIIFVDLAHNWNDGWVIKADKAEAEEAGSGKKWFGAILFSASFLFIGSVTAWGLLFHFYGGCQLNNIFIAVTLVLCLLITGAQLSGEEGSLLASAIITAYATSLCYTAGESLLFYAGFVYFVKGMDRYTNAYFLLSLVSLFQSLETPSQNAIHS